MDRDKLIEIIHNGYAEWVNGGCNGNACDKLADHLIANGIGDITAEKHRADVAEEALPKWISVEDKLPPKGHYLGLSKLNVAHGFCTDSTDGDARKNMGVFYFDSNGHWNAPKVTHWIELPQPPQQATDRCDDCMYKEFHKKAKTEKCSKEETI